MSAHGRALKDISIGIPKETCELDLSVGCDADGVERLVSMGFKVNVEKKSGLESFISDDLYSFCGGKLTNAENVFKSDVILKTNPPSTEELAMMDTNSILFCEFPNPHDKTLSELKTRKMRYVDLNKLSKNILLSYNQHVWRNMNYFGVYWKALGEIINNFGRPLCSYKNEDKVVPSAKILIEYNTDGQMLNELLKDLGADVELSEMHDGLDFKKYDIVILNDSKILCQHVYNKDLGKKLRKGAILLDIYRDEIPRCEITKPDDTIEENGITIIGLNSKQPTVRSEGISKFRGALFYSTLSAASHNQKINFDHDLFKGCKTQYEKPPVWYNQEYQNLKRTLILTDKQKLGIVSTGFMICVCLVFLTRRDIPQ